MNFCELDKYAIKSYCAIHNVDESLNLGDITKVDETQIDDFTMLCGGSPCQDFSIAGKQVGAVWTCCDCGHKYNPLETHWRTRDRCPICDSQNIEKTRSSLIVEYLRILRVKHPKFAIYENVKNIVGKQFKKTFNMFTSELHEYGYNTYWQVLNAKNYGVPQNRERVYIFIVDKNYDNGKFMFPEGFDNGIRLKDVLETEVDTKYFLSQELQNRFKFTDQTYKKNVIGTTLGEKCTRSGERDLVYNKEKIVGTITSTDYKQPKQIINNQENAHSKQCIRKLTPMECWRLMGFSDADFNAAKSAGLSDTQLYKQAGNSVVTDVLFYIYIEIYKAMPYLFDDLKLTSLFSGIGAFEIALNRLYEVINSENTFINNQSDLPNNNLIKLGNIYPSGGQNGNIYSETGISPTISSGTTNTKGNGGVGSNNAPKVVVCTNFIQPQQM